MKLFGTVLGVLFLMTTAEAAFGASVKSDYRNDFDFRQLHTFAFKTERASNDPLATNTIEAERINLTVWRGVVEDTVNAIGQTDKQANNAAKDLVKRFLSDTRRLEKRNG